MTPIRRVLIKSKDCGHVVERTHVGNQEQLEGARTKALSLRCPVCGEVVSSIEAIQDDNRFTINEEPVAGRFLAHFGETFLPEDGSCARQYMLASGAIEPPRIRLTHTTVKRKLIQLGLRPTDDLIEQFMEMPSLIESVAQVLYRCFPQETAERLRLIPIGERTDGTPNAAMHPCPNGCTVPYITINRSTFDFIYDMNRLCLTSLVRRPQDAAPQEPIDVAAESVMTACWRYFGLSSVRPRTTLNRELRMLDAFLTKAQETFVLLHEVAHAFLDHKHRVKGEAGASPEGDYYLYSHEAEFEADAWATDVLLGHLPGVASPINIHFQDAMKFRADAFRAEEVFAAPLCFLVFARILEHLAEIIKQEYGVADFDRFADHPPTLERIYQLQLHLAEKAPASANTFGQAVFGWGERVLAAARCDPRRDSRQ